MGSWKSGRPDKQPARGGGKWEEHRHDIGDGYGMRRAAQAWPRVCTATIFVLCVVTAAVASSGAASGLLRYRGQYTYGHEVRSFCPAINSQCYWVGAATGKSVHAALKKLATESADEPYRPLCVVIEGRIDREAKREGFSADYDGLISVTRVFGRCNETDIVTQGDLQHHRWLLHSVDDRQVDAGSIGSQVPELDFGERMTVSGNTGCNRFSGQAVLREQFFRIDPISTTRRLCTPHLKQLEQTVLRVLGSESTISIDVDRFLVLDSGQTILRFRLFDWKS